MFKIDEKCKYCFKDHPSDDEGMEKCLWNEIQRMAIDFMLFGFNTCDKVNLDKETKI
jgi:hypothetical protein